MLGQCKFTNFYKYWHKSLWNINGNCHKQINFKWVTNETFFLQRKHLALWVLLNIVFHGEALLAPRPTPKLEEHPSSAVRDCLFNLFAATLHIGGRSSIRNLRTRHAVVTGTHLSLTEYCAGGKIEKNEMGGACGAYGGSGEGCTGFWWGNLRERDHWEGPDADGRIILRWIFRKWEGLWELDGVGSG